MTSTTRAAAAGGTFARPELLATTAWLAEQLGRPEVRIVDVRWRPDGTARELHATGHIPGAGHLDWRADLVETDETGAALFLANPDQAARAFAAAGISNGTTVVLYDDALSLFAARVWWSLLAYGFESVRILDGGYPAWQADGRPVSAAARPPQAASFTPRADPRVRLTTADVRGLLGADGVVLLDARAPAEYHGMEGNSRRLGHIPGAVNVPVGASSRQGSQHFRPASELRAQLLRANVGRGRRMVCYDGSGVAAAKLAFILTLLGHEDVGIYDGGWAEWGDRLDLPVDR
jgi:thiosulfate/3-mercaptopyruvate sulfurtransferase